MFVCLLIPINERVMPQDWVDFVFNRGLFIYANYFYVSTVRSKAAKYDTVLSWTGRTAKGLMKLLTFY